MVENSTAAVPADEAALPAEDPNAEQAEVASENLAAEAEPTEPETTETSDPKTAEELNVAVFSNGVEPGQEQFPVADELLGGYTGVPLDDATVKAVVADIETEVNDQDGILLSDKFGWEPIEGADTETVIQIMSTLSKEDRDKFLTVWSEAHGGTSFLASTAEKVDPESVDYRRIEAVINSENGETNVAGAVRVALAMENDNEGRAEKFLQEILLPLTPDQIAETAQNFEQDYGMSLEDAIAVEFGPFDEQHPENAQRQEVLGILLKGMSVYGEGEGGAPVLAGRTKEDHLRLFDIAAASHDEELLGIALRGESPAAVEARQQILQDPARIYQLLPGFVDTDSDQPNENNEFPMRHDLAYEATLVIMARELGVDIGDQSNPMDMDVAAVSAQVQTAMMDEANNDKVAKLVRTMLGNKPSDYVLHGGLTLSTLADESEVSFLTEEIWARDTKKIMEAATKYASDEERAMFMRGMELYSGEATPENAADRMALDFYNTTNGALEKHGNGEETARWTSQILTGRDTIATALENAGDNGDKIMEVIESLGEDDWNALTAADDEAAALRLYINNVIAQEFDEKQTTDAMWWVDEKIKAENYDASQLVHRPLEEVLGEDMTDEAIINVLENIKPEEATKFKTDEDYRNQILDDVDEYMEGDAKAYARYMLYRVAQQGVAPAPDSVNAFFRAAMVDENEPEVLEAAQAMFAEYPELLQELAMSDDKLLQQQKDIKNILDESVKYGLMYADVAPDQDLGVVQEAELQRLLTTGELSLRWQSGLNFSEDEVLYRLAEAKFKAQGLPEGDGEKQRLLDDYNWAVAYLDEDATRFLPAVEANAAAMLGVAVDRAASANPPLTAEQQAQVKAAHDQAYASLTPEQQAMHDIMRQDPESAQLAMAMRSAASGVTSIDRLKSTLTNEEDEVSLTEIRSARDTYNALFKEDAVQDLLAVVPESSQSEIVDLLSIPGDGRQMYYDNIREELLQQTAMMHGSGEEGMRYANEQALEMLEYYNATAQTMSDEQRRALDEHFNVQLQNAEDSGTGKSIALEMAVGFGIAVATMALMPTGTPILLAMAAAGAAAAAAQVAVRDQIEKEGQVWGNLTGTVNNAALGFIFGVGNVPFGRIMAKGAESLSAASAVRAANTVEGVSGASPEIAQGAFKKRAETILGEGRTGATDAEITAYMAEVGLPDTPEQRLRVATQFQEHLTDDAGRAVEIIEDETTAAMTAHLNPAPTAAPTGPLAAASPDVVAAAAAAEDGIPALPSWMRRMSAYGSESSADSAAPEATSSLVAGADNAGEVPAVLPVAAPESLPIGPPPTLGTGVAATAGGAADNVAGDVAQVVADAPVADGGWRGPWRFFRNRQGAGNPEAGTDTNLAETAAGGQVVDETPVTPVVDTSAVGTDRIAAAVDEFGSSHDPVIKARVRMELRNTPPEEIGLSEVFNAEFKVESDLHAEAIFAELEPTSVPQYEVRPVLDSQDSATGWVIGIPSGSGASGAETAEYALRFKGPVPTANDFQLQNLNIDGEVSFVTLANDETIVVPNGSRGFTTMEGEAGDKLFRFEAKAPDGTPEDFYAIASAEPLQAIDAAVAPSVVPNTTRGDRSGGWTLSEWRIADNPADEAAELAPPAQSGASVPNDMVRLEVELAPGGGIRLRVGGRLVPRPSNGVGEPSPALAHAGDALGPHIDDAAPTSAPIKFSRMNEIGRGDEGIVYSNGGSPPTVTKVFHDRAVDVEAVRSMYRKLQGIGLNMPDILSVGKTADGRPALIMRQIGDGDNLQTQLSLGQIAPEDRQSLIRQYYSAVDQLKKAGWRIDLNLKNMRFEDGKLWILDPSFLKEGSIDPMVEVYGPAIGPRPADMDVAPTWSSFDRRDRAIAGADSSAAGGESAYLQAIPAELRTEAEEYLLLPGKSATTRSVNAQSLRESYTLPNGKTAGKGDYIVVDEARGTHLIAKADFESSFVKKPVYDSIIANQDRFRAAAARGNVIEVKKQLYEVRITKVTEETALASGNAVRGPDGTVTGMLIPTLESPAGVEVQINQFVVQRLDSVGEPVIERGMINQWPIETAKNVAKTYDIDMETLSALDGASASVVAATRTDGPTVHMIQISADMVDESGFYTITTAWGEMKGKVNDWLANYDYQNGAPGSDFSVVAGEAFTRNYGEAAIRPGVPGADYAIVTDRSFDQTYEPATPQSEAVLRRLRGIEGANDAGSEVAADPWTEFQLPPQAHDAVFNDEIEPFYFDLTSPVDAPKAVIIAAQTGAGKSGIVANAKSAFDGNVVLVNTDDLRAFHPQFQEIGLLDDKLAAVRTHLDASSWRDQLLDRSIETRRNIVLEGVFKDGEKLADTIERLRGSGYEVTVQFLAVDDRLSALGVLTRYEREKARLGFGRFATIEYHDETYTRLIESAKKVLEQEVANAVQVFTRDGMQIYGNRLIDDVWESGNDISSAIQRGRDKIMTNAEWAEYKALWEEVFELMRKRQASDEEIAAARAIADRFSDP